MPEFFHVDRESQLSEGQVITLSQHPKLGSPRETEVAKPLFPDGISRWGTSMLGADPPLVTTLEALQNHGLSTRIESGTATRIDQAGGDALASGKNRIIEAFAEVVRRGLAPDKPSRLAAVYAYRDPNAAELWRTNEELPHAPIWRVSVPEDAVIHEGDSRVLGIPDTVIKLIDNTILYWDGHERHDSFPWDREVLLPPPVTVLGLALA